MKSTRMKQVMRICYLIILMTPIFSTAQVGIGTTTPNAALEINSSTSGLLLPRVALTATNTEAPVVNPQTGSILAGTMVYNTNTTGGTFGVIPGMYFWDGNNWVAQFHRKFTVTNTQTAEDRFNTGDGFSNITGLNGLSFTAPYDGVYQLIFTGHLGANVVKTSADVTGFVEGFFRFTVNGIDYDKWNYAASHYMNATFQDGFRLTNEVTILVNITLNAGDTCNYNASYDPDFADNIVGAVDFDQDHLVGESSGNYGNTCEINVTYIGR